MAGLCSAGGASRHAARNPALPVAAFAERKAYDLFLSIFTLLPANVLGATVASLARANFYEQVAEINICFKSVNLN
jgi:hypothetical protein